jgi:hypothetical protein
VENNFKGFSLFNDVEDTALRARNRAIVLANISEDHRTKESRINVKGVALIMGYFGNIPKEERKEVSSLYVEEMNKRGFAIVQ